MVRAKFEGKMEFGRAHDFPSWWQIVAGTADRAGYERVETDCKFGNLSEFLPLSEANGCLPGEARLYRKDISGLSAELTLKTDDHAKPGEQRPAGA